MGLSASAPDVKTTEEVPKTEEMCKSEEKPAAVMEATSLGKAACCHQGLAR